ncbi:hypothetical protein CDAR_265531 [Caerostris darwini]|uniref:Uncharacterized protein n=1 Tax=Caerostris darwini TaxID=1538125 RepID=A0AAV4NUR7_9ARAC|nr:hypothetical protein CDAR_265531 [Caerostris darwini]
MEWAVATLGILNICRNNKRRQTIVLGERRAQRKGHPIFDPNHFHQQSGRLLKQSGHISPPESTCPREQCLRHPLKRPFPLLFSAHIVWGVSCGFRLGFASREWKHAAIVRSRKEFSVERDMTGICKRCWARLAEGL